MTAGTSPQYDFESPIWYWDPSIAPSGMTFITSDKYPEWKGGFLVGSLKFAYLVLCTVEGNTITKDEILFKGIGRVRNIRQGPDGYIYVSIEKKSDLNALEDFLPGILKTATMGYDGKGQYPIKKIDDLDKEN